MRSHRPLGVGALQSITSEGKNKARTLSREILKMSLGCGERDDKSLSARDLLGRGDDLRNGDSQRGANRIQR